jgi:hypothetical protein
VDGVGVVVHGDALKKQMKPGEGPQMDGKAGFSVIQIREKP